MKYSPYSFSKINTFFDCQKKFEFTYVNKIEIDKDYQDPSYFKRGRFLHAYIANRLNGGDGTSMKQYNVDTNDKMNLIDCADKILENEYISISYNFDVNKIESYICLDSDLIPTNSKDKSALSGYVDYYAVQDDFGMIVDWKTGKYNTNPSYDQLELYSIWLFQKYPQLTEIDMVFFYAEHNKFELKTIKPADVKKLKDDLKSKIDTIENTTIFNTSESRHCVKCAFFNTCLEKFNINVVN